ncbi:MAG: MFS transporter [Bacteroidota bacterium]|nr:MFS transporter [Bacteroidota bacterium]
MIYNRNLFLILIGVFIVMLGFGITLPVLPFYIDRFSLSVGILPEFIPFHIGLLTGIYAFMQFIFFPVFGIISDRKGRKPLILIGLAGYSISFFLFSASTSLWLLYFSRILGGIFSSAFLTSSSAYIADITPVNKRGKGMALLGGVTSLGFVAGPLMGNFLSEINLHYNYSWYHFLLDKYSIPFLVSSVSALIVFIIIGLFLRDSNVNGSSKTKTANFFTYFKNIKSLIKKTFVALLAVSFISQFSLGMFEGTFAIHSQKLFQFASEQMGLVFIVCGSVMGILQFGPVVWLIEKKGENFLLPIGLVFMGIGMSLLMSTQLIVLILIYVSLISIGMAMLIPSLSSLITKISNKQYGVSLGFFNSINSLAQATGVFIGGISLIWFTHLSYWIVALFLFTAAILISVKQKSLRISKQIL